MFLMIFSGHNGNITEILCEAVLITRRPKIGIQHHNPIAKRPISKRYFFIGTSLDFFSKLFKLLL